MPRIGISMRWWLGLAFAAIAALTALSVAQVFNRRAEAALNDRGLELAIGQSVSAASAVRLALHQGVLDDAVGVIAERRRFSLFVFSGEGQLLTPPLSRGVRFSAIPDGRLALRTALGGDRYAHTHGRDNAYVVGLRVGGSTGDAVVTYTSRPELTAELGIVQNEILRSALLAVALAAVVGLLVAALITARLRRIADAAAAIESGAFDEELRPGFGDELGALAVTIDGMRGRLRDSFGRLEAERDRLRRLLEGLQEGVLAVDPELRVAFANGSARSLFPARELQVGEPLWEPWADFPLREFAATLFEPGRSGAVQARVADGAHVYAVVGLPPASSTGDAILLVADISERERRERAEREFVANAAHELATPVTAIASSLEVLQSGAKENTVERDRFLAVIERQTARLTRLRQALLALARAQTRQEALRLEPVELRPLLEQVAAELESAPATIVVDCADGLAALAHREVVEQIVYSLVQNALKHARPTRIELAASAAGARRLLLEVRDDGRGMGQAQRERLFDRFYRAEDGGDGFGLGLAIVREAVRALGGTIEVDSAPGGGTTMRVLLAAARVAVEERA